MILLMNKLKEHNKKELNLPQLKDFQMIRLAILGQVLIILIEIYKTLKDA
jgi:hypothetical protein